MCQYMCDFFFEIIAGFMHCAREIRAHARANRARTKRGGARVARGDHDIFGTDAESRRDDLRNSGLVALAAGCVATKHEGLAARIEPYCGGAVTWLIFHRHH